MYSRPDYGIAPAASRMKATAILIIKTIVFSPFNIATGEVDHRDNYENLFVEVFDKFAAERSVIVFLLIPDWRVVV